MKIYHTIFLIIGLFTSICLGQELKSYKQLKNRIDVPLSGGILSMYPLTDNAVRIKFSKNPNIRLPELVFTSRIRTPQFSVSDAPSRLELKGKDIIVIIDKQHGTLSFADNSGKVFLSEKAGARKLSPDTDLGEPCFIAEQSFESQKDEYIYGLGQFQDGHYNLKNITRRLFIRLKDTDYSGISMD